MSELEKQFKKIIIEHFINSSYIEDYEKNDLLERMENYLND